MVNRLDYDGNAMWNRGEIKFMTNSTKQQKAGQTVDAKETNKQKEEKRKKEEEATERKRRLGEKKKGK